MCISAAGCVLAVWALAENSGHDVQEAIIKLQVGHVYQQGGYAADAVRNVGQ